MAKKNKSAKKKIDLKRADIDELTSYFNCFPEAMMLIMDVTRLTNRDLDNIEYFERYHSSFIESSIDPSKSPFEILASRNNAFDYFDSFKDKIDKDLFILYIYSYYLSKDETDELTETDKTIEKEMTQIRLYLSDLDILLKSDIEEPDFPTHITDFEPDERYTFHIKTSLDYVGITNTKLKAARDAQRASTLKKFAEFKEKTNLVELVLGTIYPMDLQKFCKYPMLASLISARVYKTPNHPLNSDSNPTVAIPGEAFNHELLKKLLVSNMEYMDFEQILMISLERIYASLIDIENPQAVVTSILENFKATKEFISRSRQTFESTLLVLDPNTNLPITKPDTTDTNFSKTTITLDMLIKGMEQLSKRYINGQFMTAEYVQETREKLLSGERGAESISLNTFQNVLKYSKYELYTIASHSISAFDYLKFCGLITDEDLDKLQSPTNLSELFLKRNNSPEQASMFRVYHKLFDMLCLSGKNLNEKNQIGKALLSVNTELHSAENLKELHELGLITTENYVETGGIPHLIELFNKRGESQEAKIEFETYSQLYKAHCIDGKTDAEKDEVGMSILFDRTELHSAESLKELFNAGLITASNYTDFGENTLLIQLFKEKDKSPENAAEFERYCQLYKVHYINDRTVEEQDQIGNSILQNNPEFHNIEQLKELLDLGLITSNNYAQFGGIQHLVDLFLSRKDSAKAKDEFLSYSREFYRLCIENKPSETKDALGELIIGQNDDFLENKNVKLLQRLNLVTSKTYIEYVLSNAIIDLLKSDAEIQPQTIRELYDQGTLRMEDLIAVMRTKKIPSNKKLTFAYSVFPDIEADEENRNRLVSNISKKVKDISPYGDNPGGHTRHHITPEPAEHRPRRIYDPAAKFELLKHLDDNYSYELSQNGYLIFYLPRFHKYIYEKLYDSQSTSDDPRYAYGAATYVRDDIDDEQYQQACSNIITEVRVKEELDSDEESDEFDRLLEDEGVVENQPRTEKIVNLSVLRQLNKQRLIRRYYHKRWAERICEEFGVHEEGRYTPEQIEEIERLARIVEETAIIRE